MSETQVGEWSTRSSRHSQFTPLVAIAEIPPGVLAGSLRLRKSRAKRAIDIAGASLGLLILLPLFLVIALVIVGESEGPIFFRQRRSGLDGRQFLIYKFRSMRVMEDGSDVTQATRNDDRVTRFGKFLRRSSFDEFPQLINVLKGEMSLVGPRPHAVAHDQYYLQTVPSYSLRFHGLPGITGLAQVSGYRGEVRDVPHMEARVEKDLEYIAQWSFWLDIQILLRTAFFAPFHRMAY